MSTQDIKLTQFSKAAGCGCKIAPAVLQEILKTEHTFSDVRLLVGNEHNDDAAVYDTGNGDCIVSTTDFFMPIVDDAFDFGRVAATNAISDVYAMGGKPLMAVAILGWPVEKLGAGLAQKLLDGARTQCKKAGIPLAGGHSIESSEPIFGLAVTGTVKKAHLKKNNTVQENDLLYLTKPLGSGVYATALKRGVLAAEDLKTLTDTLCELNSIGEELGKLNEVTAMTDVTGFGLNGHLLEMLSENNYTAKIFKKDVPVFKNLDHYAKQFIFPDNTTRNFNACSEKVKGMSDLDFITFCDPQTSGGLLFTVRASAQLKFENWMREKNYFAVRIGAIVKGEAGTVEFV